MVEFKGPVGKMNNWTMHNKTNYYSYWMEQIDKMLSSQVENLRYYEDIGYYYPMREEIPPMRERPTKKFSDLPVIFQAHNIIIEHIYEKISIDLLFESKEIDCDVKRKAFGVNKKKIEEKILKNEHLDSDMTTPQTLSSFSPMSKSRVDINFEEMLKSRKKLKKRKPQGSAQEIAERMRKKRINEQINSHIFNMDTTNSKPKYLFENANKDKEFGPILKEFFARNEKLLKLQQGGKVDKDGNILKIDLLEYQREFEVYGKEVYKFPSDEEEEEKLSSMGEILEEKFEFQIKLHQATEKVLEESESCGSDIEEMSGQLLRTRKKIHSEGNLLIHVSPIFQRKELSQNG